MLSYWERVMLSYRERVMLSGEGNVGERQQKS